VPWTPREVGKDEFCVEFWRGKSPLPLKWVQPQLHLQSITAGIDTNDKPSAHGMGGARLHRLQSCRWIGGALGFPALVKGPEDLVGRPYPTDTLEDEVDRRVVHLHRPR
jgi:hypothetical protein